jgi:hypothetical protein
MSMAELWPSEAVTYVRFKIPQKFETQNMYLLFWLKGKFQNKHKTYQNESILLALSYKVTVKLTWNACTLILVLKLSFRDMLKW